MNELIPLRITTFLYPSNVKIECVQEYIDRQVLYYME